jgi:hypothetical protein
MSISHLMRFLDHQTAATTLSKLLGQSFAAYPIKLESARLQRATPFQLSASGRGNEDHHEAVVTLLADGNVAVEYRLFADCPPYMLGTLQFGVLGLDAYRLSARSTVSMESLKYGRIVASEPVVQVNIELKDNQLTWYRDENGHLVNVPCPYLNEGI